MIKSKLIIITSKENEKMIKEAEGFLLKLGFSSEIIFEKDESSIPQNAVSIAIDDIKAFIPFEELVDIKEEIERLTQEKERLEKEVERGEKMLSNPGFIINLLGLWIPTGISILLSLIFFKRIDTGIFRKERWMILGLAAVNLVLSFIVHNAPFIFIICLSILVFHIFYRFYFASPISQNEKSLTDRSHIAGRLNRLGIARKNRHIKILFKIKKKFYSN